MKRAGLWMPLYIGDYLGDTMHLTRDEHGGYLLLIMAYWRNGGPLPDDDELLRQITKSSKFIWKNLRQNLSHFFEINSGFWHHKRIDAELAEAVDITEKRTVAGKRGAEARWHGKRIANGMANACTTPTPIQEEEDSEAKASGAAKPPQPAQPVDPVKEIFDRGLAILGGDNRRHRSLLGKMRKHYHDPVVLAAIVDCETEAPSNPAAFFVACCERRKKTNGRGDAQSALAKLAEWAREEDEPQSFRSDHKAAGGFAR